MFFNIVLIQIAILYLHIIKYDFFKKLFFGYKTNIMYLIANEYNFPN